MILLTTTMRKPNKQIIIMFDTNYTSAMYIDSQYLLRNR